jgi:hypothetical protein
MYSPQSEKRAAEPKISSPNVSERNSIGCGLFYGGNKPVGLFPDQPRLTAENSYIVEKDILTQMSPSKQSPSHHIRKRYQQQTPSPSPPQKSTQISFIKKQPSPIIYQEQKSVIVFQQEYSHQTKALYYTCTQLNSNSPHPFNIILPSGTKLVIKISNTQVILLGPSLYIFNIPLQTFTQLPLSLPASTLLSELSDYKCVYHDSYLYIACGKYPNSSTNPEIFELSDQFSAISLKTGQLVP